VTTIPETASASLAPYSGAACGRFGRSAVCKPAEESRGDKKY